MIPLPPGDADLRKTDRKADPAGRFVGGTMTLGDPRPGAGSLWSYSDGRAVELVGGVTTSNGLASSADGSTLFYIDTPTRQIDAFTYAVATGAVADRRTVVDVPAGAGDPDGVCIDAEGGFGVALWGGAAVHRYVDGRLAAVAERPTPYVACPTFAGAELGELVVTTASEPFGHDDVPPGAGDLYVAPAGAQGTPAHLASLDALLGPRSDAESFT